MPKLIKEKKHNPHKVSTATRPTLKGAIAGIAYGTNAGRALQKKIKKYGEDVSSKVGESRSHMPKEQDGQTQQQKKRRVPYH